MEQVIDWLMIDGQLRLRYGTWRACHHNKGETVVVLGGRGEFLEKYLETARELTDRGMTVFSFDWRGQGLSSRQAQSPNLGHVDSFQQYLEDLDLFLDRVVRPQTEGVPLLLAHSMGAHLGLRYLAENPGAFERAVLISPMIAINTGTLPADLLYRVSRAAVKLGMAKMAVPFTSGRNAYLGSFEGNLLTGSRRRFQKNQNFLKSNPDLLVDSVSFGWLKAAFDSIRHVTGNRLGRKIRIPVLMVAAGDDKVVSVRAAEKLFRKMPSAVVVVMEGARHEILQEQDSIRAGFWRLFNEFIKQHCCL